MKLYKSSKLMLILIAIFCELATTEIATAQDSISLRNSLYLKTIEVICQNVSASYPELLNSDTIYFNNDVNQIKNVPKKINNVVVLFKQDYELLYNTANLYVFNIRKLEFDGTASRIYYDIELLNINNRNQTFICCEGCAGGGLIDFTVNVGTYNFIPTQFSLYNCFKQ